MLNEQLNRVPVPLWGLEGRTALPACPAPPQDNRVPGQQSACPLLAASISKIPSGSGFGWSPGGRAGIDGVGRAKFRGNDEGNRQCGRANDSASSGGTPTQVAM